MYKKKRKTSRKVRYSKPKKRGRKKKRGVKKATTKNIEALFDESADDLSYITSSKLLLRKHLKLIDDSKYLAPTKYVVKSGKYEGRSPMSFYGFATRYKNLYNWWIHIVRSCLDPEYDFYRFFGAKGVSLSIYFIESKRFCKWALRKGLVNGPFTYKQFLVRKDKSMNFTKSNLRVTSEVEVHRCNSLRQALESIQLIKEYEEGHDPSVSFLTFHTRYYMYDLDSDDSRYLKYNSENGFASLIETLGFSPTKFYNSVATDESCSFSTFKSRMHYSYLNGGFIARPHDMLKPEYSVSEEANRQNKLSYKQQYERNKKLKENSVYKFTNNNEDIYISNDDVYSNNDNIYSK